MVGGDVEISGAGSLAAAFRALFEKLEKEGLFDPEYKKPIPAFRQKNSALITSETGCRRRGYSEYYPIEKPIGQRIGLSVL